MASRQRKALVEVVHEERKLTPAVEETLGHLELQPEDAAAARLALSYARTIDQASAIAAAAAKIPFDEDTAEEVAKLAKRVSAQVTMADLGPKLLAILDALSATPKSRAALAKPPSAPTGAAKLALLRQGKLG